MRVNLQAEAGQPCQTCRTAGGARVVQIDDRGKPIKPPAPAPTPYEGIAVDLYFDGLSYCWTA